MRIFLNWFIALIVVALTLLLVALAAAENRPKYRAHTPEEFIQIYQTQSLQEMIGALQKARFSAEITEALKCPCYDVITSTESKGRTIIRIDKGRCQDIISDNKQKKVR